MIRQHDKASLFSIMICDNSESQDIIDHIVDMDAIELAHKLSLIKTMTLPGYKATLRLKAGIGFTAEEYINCFDLHHIVLKSKEF